MKPIILLGRSIFVLLILGVLLGACGSKKIRMDITLQERMEIALQLFEKRKFFDAKTQFRIITLSHGGSSSADKAQFYLAECHYFLKEYILSASEYERLLKIYPNSEYVDDAKFKLGMSYVKLSPKPALDQDYTTKAIREFQEFLEDFYASPLVPEVEKMLLQAREKLANKLYMAADQYRKMNDNTAAIIYFEKVLDRYYDTDFAPKAQYYKAECLRKNQKYDESLIEFQTFLSKYPTHQWAGRAKSKITDLNNRMRKTAPPSGNQLSTTPQP